MLGDFEVRQTRKYKYLGIYINENGCERAINERISRPNQRLGRLSSVARMSTSKYDVVREVWKGATVPSIMYSKDVCISVEQKGY